jgi:hypothetical protein
MKIRLYIYFVCGISFFSACEKSLPYNSEGFTPKLVINGFNSSDSFMQIAVSLSTSTLKTPSMYELEGECKVLLLKDNLLLLSDSFDLVKGKIILPFKATTGSIYELQLSYGDFPSIKAIDSVPLEIPELYIDTLLRNAVYYTFNVRVKDFSTLQKYQFQTLVHGKELIDSDSIETTYSLPFYSTDKIFISTIRTVAGENTFALFGDELWNGQERNIDLRVLKNDILRPNFTPKYAEIILSNLSLNMYTYYASLLQNNHVYGGPLSSVTDLNGNIDQGLGGFYFYTQNMQRIEL